MRAFEEMYKTKPWERCPKCGKWTLFNSMVWDYYGFPVMCFSCYSKRQPKRRI